MTRKVTLVCGPPCAGKTTWVAQRAQPDDIVLDQDVIGPAAMRVGLAHVAAMTSGTAWVIRCAPGRAHREALARQLGAEIVLLDPGIDEAIRRALGRPEPRAAIRAVRDWYRQEGETVSTAWAGGGTRAHRRAKQEMFRLYGDRCHLCGHGGARQADHLVPLSIDPTQRRRPDPTKMRPAHGTDNPCPTCGRKCNQERQDKPVDTVYRPVLDW